MILGGVQQRPNTPWINPMGQMIGGLVDFHTMKDPRHRGYMTKQPMLDRMVVRRGVYQGPTHGGSISPPLLENGNA
jgi:hypothetical protein